MGTLYIILLAGAITLISLGANYLFKRKKRTLEIQLKIKEQNDEYEGFLEEFASYINFAVKNIIPFDDKYCSWTDLQNNIKHIQSEIPIRDIPKRYRNENSLHESYQAVLNYISNGDKLRKEHNTAFIKHEEFRCNSYFRTLLANPLDKQQIDAILHDDDNTLVIAGAGCGKTTTVQGKVSYLLNNKIAKPDEILLLSFAKKNADDLKVKLGHLGVECRTFHSLAYQIIKESDRAPDVISPEAAEQIIIESHQELVKDETYLASFNDLILNGLRIIKNENEFTTYKDYIEYLKDSEFESLKGMLSKKRFHKNDSKRTLNNEFVKSGEECYIANFLFLHGVEYSYEAPYIYHKEIDADERYDKNKKRYRPDFTIYLNGYDEYSIKACPNPKENMLFLEHYGIDEHGNTPQFFDEHKNMSSTEYYKSIMKWKDEVHAQYGTTLLKSYSYEFKNKTIEENLIEHLLQSDVVLRPKSNTEIYQILQEAYSKEIEAVIKLVSTFISLLKSNNKTFAEVYEANERLFKHDRPLLDRNNHLLQLIEYTYQRYQAQLDHLQKVDFNDLINRAQGKIAVGQYQHSYKYLMVDEFQDISLNRYELLNALKKQSYCKLFAVGDDWQSIYRFTGSDLTLFRRFENYFGHTVTKKIETTYRFADPLISISSQFILKNPNQAKKVLRAGRSVETEVKFDYSKTEEQPINQNILNILQELYVEYGESLASKSIAVLGRYNFDINQLTEDKQVFLDKEKGHIYISTLLKDVEVDEQGNTIRDNQLQLDKKIDYLTVHKAKGLESDFVILINCETGKYGFPAELSDDKILNLLLSGDDQYPNGEERRAFYVALTRAKEKFYFVADKRRQSKFVREIYSEHIGYQEEVLACQKCEAELRFIKDIRNKFGLAKMFGCTNFKYGCDYSTFIKETELNPLLALNKN